ncbi:MAG: hypothetical protein ACFFFK_02890, partial [Candidatus Thorarchaeota archaeon]
FSACISELIHCRTIEMDCQILVIFLPLLLGCLDIHLIWTSSNNSSITNGEAILLSMISCGVALEVGLTFLVDLLGLTLSSIIPEYTTAFVILLSFVMFPLSMLMFLLVIVRLSYSKQGSDGLEKPDSTRTY